MCARIFAEEGLYLALDLGGTNFRVLLLELAHGAPIRQEVKQYYIGSELRVGSAIPLFDYLAECVSDFVISQGLQNVELPLGKLSSAYGTRQDIERVKSLINRNCYTTLCTNTQSRDKIYRRKHFCLLQEIG